MYNTPVRVFGKLPGSNLDFCDYKFQDEKLEEVIDRIEELLDIKMDPTELELDCEQVACKGKMFMYAAVFALIFFTYFPESQF